jgi:hypothetical protein
VKIERVTIRLATPLRHAVERMAKAAGLSEGVWIRRLLESETGTQPYEHPRGFAALPKRARREAQKAAVASRLENREQN